MKYIETELKKRKGIVEHEEQKVKQKNAEDCLYELPENIRVSSAKKTEEMLSNQMLSGIPEVDLGIDAKIKNIISTEDAKARLLAEQQNKKKDSETSFVPTNMAVNYVQHNRCKFLCRSSSAPAPLAQGLLVPIFCLTRPLVSFGSVYHEELNAPIRRNKEEPKARPLRVGDTEKPEPEREYSRAVWAAWSGYVAWCSGGRWDKGGWSLGSGARTLGFSPCPGLQPRDFPIPNFNFLIYKMGMKPTTWICSEDSLGY